MVFGARERLQCFRGSGSEANCEIEAGNGEIFWWLYPCERMEGMHEAYDGGAPYIESKGAEDEWPVRSKLAGASGNRSEASRASESTSSTRGRPDLDGGDLRPTVPPRVVFPLAMFASRLRISTLFSFASKNPFSTDHRGERSAHAYQFIPSRHSDSLRDSHSRLRPTAGCAVKLTAYERLYSRATRRVSVLHQVWMFSVRYREDVDSKTEQWIRSRATGNKRPSTEDERLPAGELAGSKRDQLAVMPMIRPPISDSRRQIKLTINSPVRIVRALNPS
ncbi:hypothetical protein C8R44DRAFT_732651 [Mycena epipterygia]|nr:hypothetical protein C8R44DRAFT_732651 [Mycena epipterygia]